MDVNSFADYNGFIYFKAYQNIPGTFMLDKKKNTITVLKEDEPENYKSGAYFRCYRINDYIVYLPYVSDYFSIFNVRDNEFSYIKKKKNVYYRNGIAYNNKFFAFPEDGDLSEIAVIDVSKRDIKYPFDSVKETHVISFCECCCNDRYVYTCINKKDTIARLNLENYSFEEIGLNVWDLQYKTIIHYDGSLYLTGEFDALVHLDENFNCERINLLNEYMDDDNSVWQLPRFSDCRVIDNYIYFSPLKYRCVIRLDLSKNEIDYIFPIEDKCISWGVSEYDDCAYMVLVQEAKDLRHLLIHSDGRIEENNLFKLINCNNLFSSSYNLLKEDMGMTLDEYIEVIKVGG